jgi:hypothetical protein
MGIMAMTVAMIFLTAVAGYLLWTLVLHYEDIRTAAECEGSHPRSGAPLFLFLTLTGLIIVGTLAALLVEVQQLFTAGSL